MILTIDAASPTPPYEQLRAQLVDAVQTEALVAGTRLPTVRRLADDLGLAPNTVARAYRELERDGIIETRGRHGSFIAPQGDSISRQAHAAANEYVERMSRLGVAADEAIRLVTVALGAVS